MLYWAGTQRGEGRREGGSKAGNKGRKGGGEGRREKGKGREEGRGEGRKRKEEKVPISQTLQVWTWSGLVTWGFAGGSDVAKKLPAVHRRPGV